MKSFRTKMTIMIVAVVLGSTILLSLISYQRARKTLVSQLEDNYSVAAQKYSLELSSWVSNNATIIDTMAAEIAVNDISTKGYDEFHDYLKRSNDLLNKNGYVYDVYFTYPNNFMVCASDFLADGSVDFVNEREWYTTSALTGELFFSTPYLDSDTKKPVFTISKAVYKDGELLGVLAADIFVDVLVDMINNADVADNSYAFLMDENLNVIVHPNDDYYYEDKPIYILDVPGAPYSDVVNAIKSGQCDNMEFVTDYDNVTRGIVSAQMTNTKWYVGIATDRSQLGKEVNALMRGFIIATIVAISIGAGVAIILARVIDRFTKKEQEYKQQVLKLEKQAADEASEAKSRFLADMSHEIRTPINAILGMNEMILRESEDEDILGYSQNIKQSGNTLLQLINGILDFSKIEDGKMEIVPVRYKTASLISYYQFSISGRAQAKNLKLVFDIDPNLPTELMGDDTRINQVVINLLTNAVKYTEKGTITLTIKEKERKDGNINIFFAVKDTGIGIKSEDMTKLFESFERLDVIRNRNIEGTGLGMTISGKLLDLMGSKMNVESVYGEGSTFSFELWQKIENEKPIGDYKKAIERAEEVEVYKESFRAPEARILVVDDTKMNIFVVENLLKKTKVQIDTALNGPESIKLAASTKYDLILMDQRMPGMDGTEALRLIKEDGLNTCTPAICLTADVIRGAKERYISLGFDDYLTKPVEGELLESMLRTYLPKDKVEIVDDDEFEDTANSDSEKQESNSKSWGEGIEDKKDAKGSESNNNSDDSLWNELSKVGISKADGMRFCSNDEDMYRSILEAYVSESKEKSENLKTTFASKDLENYEIYVHSLKSTSKTIGAMELFNLAAESEAAAKEKDGKTVEKNHETIMNMYSKIVEAIKKNLNLGEDEKNDEDEILEFLPE